MKKTFKFYLCIWGILLVLFNIIAFVSVGWAGTEKYTASFWIGYVCITLSFIGQMICGYYALKDSSVEKTFYNLSLITTSYTGLILSFIFGGLCMLISPLPYWVGIILCAIVLAFSAITVIKAAAAIELITEVDEKVKSNTFFIKALTGEAGSLMSRAKNEAVKEECRKIYEGLRFSDPMSSESLNEIEDEIREKFIQFSEIVASGDSVAVREVAAELMGLIEERNFKNRRLK